MYIISDGWLICILEKNIFSIIYEYDIYVFSKEGICFLLLSNMETFHNILVYTYNGTPKRCMVINISTLKPNLPENWNIYCSCSYCAQSRKLYILNFGIHMWFLYSKVVLEWTVQCSWTVQFFVMFDMFEV